MKVFVYFNLHRKLWSIKALEGPEKGRVVGHAQALYLADPVPKVSEAGRQRVIREKRKNVHAGLVGNLMAVDKASPLWSRFPYYGSAWQTGGSELVTYNPYRFSTFVMADDVSQALTGGTLALFTGDKRVRVWTATTTPLEALNQMALPLTA